MIEKQKLLSLWRKKKHIKLFNNFGNFLSLIVTSHLFVYIFVL